MEYFVYGRDRPGALDLKLSLAEPHWSFMDGYADLLVARGPTLTADSDDAEPTGSLHIVDLPDTEAAHEFAFQEPYYRAGVFESVLLCRFRNISGRTMWEFTDPVDDYGRFLVIAMDDAVLATATSRHIIVYGELLALDGEARLGWAALVEAPDRESAADLLTSGGGHAEVQHWRFGGRPAQR